MNYKQSQFLGIVTGVDLEDIPENNAYDCSNIDLSILGELKSIDGMEKQITTGLNSTIDYIHYANDTTYVLYNGIIAKL